MAKKMNKKMTQGMIALAVVLLVVYVLKVRGLVEFKKKKKRVCGRSALLKQKLEPGNVYDVTCKRKCREQDLSKCKKGRLEGSCMYKRGGSPFLMPLKQACKIKWV